jgi:hypothetical protein
MTLEEFFKKKRIDLAALEKAEGVLFSEFKAHYGEMGEKSFDHTKKYWFNKLRRQFPLAVEVKTEKPHIANPLAEQTITESLAETVIAAPAPKLGFVPKFKAGNMPKPAAAINDKKEEAQGVQVSEDKRIDDPVETAENKPAYKPRFSPKTLPQKPKEE